MSSKTKDSDKEGLFILDRSRKFQNSDKLNEVKKRHEEYRKNLSNEILKPVRSCDYTKEQLEERRNILVAYYEQVKKDNPLYETDYLQECTVKCAHAQVLIIEQLINILATRKPHESQIMSVTPYTLSPTVLSCINDTNILGTLLERLV